METPCQSLARSANQDCNQCARVLSAPPSSRQRPPFTHGLFLSILQNLEEEKTGDWLGEKERQEQQRFNTLLQPCSSIPSPPIPPTPVKRGSSATGIHFGMMHCLGQEVSRGQ